MASPALAIIRHHGMVPEMPAALERLYVVFGRFPRPASVAGCPDCVRGDGRRLLDQPLRLLEPDGVLARYAAAALLTWGGAEDFCYFLPRLLECAVAGAFSYPVPEIVFGKLAIAGWQDWPDERRAAAGSFLAAWWADVLAGDRPGLKIGTVVCCLGAAGADMASFLERWGRLETVTAIGHLHEFVMSEVLWRPAPVLLNAFWNATKIHGTRPSHPRPSSHNGRADFADHPVPARGRAVRRCRCSRRPRRSPGHGVHEQRRWRVLAQSG
jgi:hypothetical protein